MIIKMRTVPKAVILFFVFLVVSIAFLSVAAAMGLTESTTRRGLHRADYRHRNTA